MLALLSPAKSLDLDSPLPTKKHTMPRLLDDSTELIEVMRTKSVADVAGLMGISDDLAALNVERYASWETPFTPRKARPAMLMFDGDVYQGINARERFDARDWTEAQKTVRILSGLYGLLRPLDLVQAYRLEMGTKVRTGRGADLYAFWGDRLTTMVRDDLGDSPGAEVVVNLASAEYSGAVALDDLDARVIAPRFEDRSPKGEWKVISFHAKRARGEMAGWMVEQRARTAKSLLEFDGAGYRYAKDVSSPDVPVFRRG